MFSNVFKYIDELTCLEELQEIIQAAKDRIKYLEIKEEE